jgi:glycosyltransferase involved in cell wall biosynthesis
LVRRIDGAHGPVAMAAFCGRTMATFWSRRQGKLRRIAVQCLVSVARAVLRDTRLTRSFVSGIILLSLLRINRNLLDINFYRGQYGRSRLVRWIPQLEFAFRGAQQLKNPCAAFSQLDYARQRPFVLGYPPILHFLLYGRYEPEVDRPSVVGGMAEAQSSILGAAAETLPPPADRLEQLWPLLQADLIGLRDVAHQLTPNVHLKHKLSERRITAPVSLASAVTRAVLGRFPSRVDHLIIVPWLGVSGGSEKVSQRLIQLLREHYSEGGLCVFAPDSVFDLSVAQRRSYGVPIVAINDSHPTLDLEARTELVDRALINLRPRTVHTINSDAGWFAFLHHAQHYARDSKLFGNIYSDIRILEDIPVGAFWRFLPETFEHLTGVFADNQAVINRATENFGLLPAQISRHHVVPTPILGLAGHDPMTELRPFHNPGLKHSLWMSRIALEKRMDILQAITVRCPDRSFSVYGAVLPSAKIIDLSWADEMPNVHLCGHFRHLSDLPVENFDSYIFTTSAEGMPIALLEAAMMGLPIVAPAVGGIGEFIDCTTGWLVSGPDAVDEYVAALEHIHRHPEEAARRVRAAQARLLERHSWSNFRRIVRAIPGYLNRVGD